MAALCAALATSSAAFAQADGAARPAETAALGWVRLAGADTCPSAQALARAVEARVGRSVLVSPTRADLFIEAHVQPLADGSLRAVVKTTRKDGSEVGVRVLESRHADCVELGGKLALVIAITIDPDAALAAPKTPEPELEAEPSAEPRPPEKPELRLVIRRQKVIVREAPSPRRPWQFSARLGATATVGILPGLTPGLAVGVGAVPPGLFAFELTGRAWPEREAEVDGGGAKFTLFAAGLAACPAAELGAARAYFCGGLSAGALRARGFGFDASSEQSRPVVLATAGLRLRLPLSQAFFIYGGGAIEGALVRPRFFYRDATGQEREIYRVPPVSGLLELGVGLHFSS